MTTDASPRPKHQLITGGDPNARFDVPGPEMFLDLEGDQVVTREFLLDEKLSRIGQAVIEKKLARLDDGEFTCDFLWKRKGGVSKGNAMLGNCVKLGSAAKFYARQVKVLVYLAADHCGDLHFSNMQIEALVYHELLKVTREEKWSKPDKFSGKRERLPTAYGIQGPDFSGFYEEIREYGLWQQQLERLPEVVQPALPLA